jgi:peptidoglycan hydrolase CwlO-like protein
MKWVIIVVWVFIASVFVVFAVPSAHQAFSKALTYSECNSPLPYKIGVIDARFNLSQDNALADITKATDIWSKQDGKNLFTYSQKADLTVNFIYDQRQALDTQINNLNNQVNEQNLELKQKIAQYEQDSANFKTKLNNFIETVNKYNREGGAPEGAYNDLIKQQNELKAEADSLNSRAKELNLSTSDYNSQVSALNSDINQFNKALAVKPEEGLYNGNNNTITIYFASNQDELIHTLAHEFGHALGMQHVKDPQAIMYPNTTKYLTPTPSDLTELNYVCRNQSAILHGLEVADLWIYNTVAALAKSLNINRSQ